MCKITKKTGKQYYAGAGKVFLLYLLLISFNKGSKKCSEVWKRRLFGKIGVTVQRRSFSNANSCIKRRGNPAVISEIFRAHG